MRKFQRLVLGLVLVGAALLFSGCGKPPSEESLELARNVFAQEGPYALLFAYTTEEQGAEAAQARTIEVRSGETVVTYALEDNAAADALLAQLPLTIEIEDYSTNEKIFYPPQALETAGTPAASGGAGVLAYYEPWGDVVLFYDGFSENASLFALGRAVSGAESIRDLAGTVTVAVAEG